MNEIGFLFLLLSFISSVGAAFTARKNVHLARASIILSGISSLISVLLLGLLFLNNDYSNQYVWQFSSKEMDPFYKFAAIWGGMDGSMLLWAAIQGIGATIVARDIYKFPKNLANNTLLFLAISNIFFLGMTLFLTNPFQYIKSEIIPLDGNGLNPLLQNPFMAIHPPIMYFGLTWFAIPASIAFAALISPTKEWYQYCRRWTLLAWGFLTAGKVLGGYWAYIELGWGGFWAWDPVENASFIPWLTGTALLHSVMVEERKGMLKLWNIWLALATYSLTVFGTFLTRSGVVQSVHAFASTDIGWVFLLYLSLYLSVAIFFTFRVKHTPDRHIESFISREAIFLLNNLILLGIAFATLWGVLFPVFSEWFTGQKQTVGIPYFNAVNVPLFLLMLFFMGVGPLVSWKHTTLAQLKKQFLAPIITAFVVGLMLVWAGVPGFYPILSYSLCVFVFLTIIKELHRRKKDPTTFLRTLGAHTVHLGVLLATIGITASMAHKIERDFVLAEGQSYSVGRFQFTLKELTAVQSPSFEELQAVTEIVDTKSGDIIAVRRPASRFYYKKKENTSEVSILKLIKGDVYLVMAGLDDSGTKAAMKVFINPLQSLLWIGTGVMIFGLSVILLERARSQRT